MRFLGHLLVAIALGACSALPQPPTAPANFYVLAARPAPAPVAQRRDIALEVATPRAWPGFDTTDLVYTRAPFVLDRFATSRWVDTPPRMLAPLIVRALEDTGAFRAVLEPPTTAIADYRLDTEVVRIVQDFSASPSRTDIALRVQLTDLRARRVVATRVFEAVEPSATENAAGGVVAANVALTRLLAQTAQFCVEEALRPAPPRP
jgi:cholesterol transport system auxiliary component